MITTMKEVHWRKRKDTGWIAKALKMGWIGSWRAGAYESEISGDFPLNNFINNLKLIFHAIASR